MPSSIEIEPRVPICVVNIGLIKETETCDWAAKLYPSSGRILFSKFVIDDESKRSE